MTLAWYGHLRFKSASLGAAILASWLLALPEVRASSASQSLRVWMAQCLSTQDPSEMHHVDRLCFLRLVCPRGKVQPKHLLAFGLILSAVVILFRE